MRLEKDGEVTTPNAELVPVHGGLDALVDRTVPLKQRAAFLAEAASLPRLRVTNADLSTVYRIADGALSPLEGPMKRDAWHRVLDEQVVLSKGGRYAWTIPLSFPATDDEASALAGARAAAVVNEAGDVVGILDGPEVFDWDKAKYVAAVYGTERIDHPGGRMVTNDARGKLVGGALRALPQPRNREYGEYMLSPRVVRALVADRKYEAALAFQTRNPLHRAHEYALVWAGEYLTKQGLYTGIFLNPLMGELKGDDVPAAMRMRCYRKLHGDRLLGQGDQQPEIWEKAGYPLADVFELVGLDIKMFYGGPREAVMHGIYRQNYGFSHLIIGRKHADAPYEDGSAIWGDFDAQEIFQQLKGDLRIGTVNVGFAAFYESLGRVDLTENHPDEKPVSVSGTKVREQLKGGERPDPRIMRPEIADILIEAYRD